MIKSLLYFVFYPPYSIFVDKNETIMKNLSFTLLFIFHSVLVAAVPINKQQALQHAKSFLGTHGLQVAVEAHRAPSHSSVNDTQPFYIFNAADNQGFVIIAGDDRAETVLGYSDTGHYDESDIPDNFRAWLDQTASDIRSLPTSENTTIAAPRHVAVHSAIAPLIETKWGQGKATTTGYIFNTLTPTINSKHCLTGCAATAGAQLMYYYRYPQEATEVVPGYQSNNLVGTLSDLPAIQFNWSKMKATYNSSDTGTDSEKAVSELMQYCGYAARTSYGTGSSGANAVIMARGLVWYFDYDPNTWQSVTRANYSINDWDALIYEELKSGRPVILSGNGTQGGHAFICDGYDGAGMYHFNWGWNGSYNGYFKLNATNPFEGNKISSGKIDNGFTLDVSAIIGLQPNTGLIPSGNDDNDTWDEPTPENPVINLQISDFTCISSRQPKFRQTMQFKVTNLGDNYSGTLHLFVSATEDKGYRKSWTNIMIRQGNTKERTLNFTAGDAGIYNVWLCSDSKGENVLAQTTVEITQDIEATNFDFTGNKFATILQPVVVSIKSNAGDFTQPLYFFASTDPENKVSTYNVYGAIEGGQSEDITFYFIPSEAGEYTVWVCTDAAGNNVVGTAQVTINPIPDYQVELTSVSLDVETQPTGEGTGKLCVSNETPYDYYESFHVILWSYKLYNDSYYYTQIWDAVIPPYHIETGHTANITVPLSDLQPDVNYSLEIEYKPYVGGSYKTLCETQFTLSLPEFELGDVNHDGQVSVTDVMMLVNHILSNPLSNFHEGEADMNGDHQINVTDVMLIVKRVLTKG